jgi:hypothetical protein
MTSYNAEELITFDLEEVCLMPPQGPPGLNVGPLPSQCSFDVPEYHSGWLKTGLDGFEVDIKHHSRLLSYMLRGHTVFNVSVLEERLKWGVHDLWHY